MAHSIFGKAIICLGNVAECSNVSTCLHRKQSYLHREGKVLELYSGDDDGVTLFLLCFEAGYRL